MMEWTITDPRYSVETLGLVPMFLTDADPRPAAEQFEENYAHGGGWSPFEGFTLDTDNMELSYPGDPAIFPIGFP